LVVNDRNECVGIVQGFAEGNLASVVPVWSVSDLVKKSQPDRYPDVFSLSDVQAMYRPDRSELVPVDFAAQSRALAQDAGPEVGMSPARALPEEYLWYGLSQPIPTVTSFRDATHMRPEEPPAVKALRAKAQEMVERIQDLIAVGAQRSVGGRVPEVT